MRACQFFFPLIASVSIAAGADWPQWRGPLRNGIALDSPKLIDAFPADGLKVLWESEQIPSNDEGGLASVIAAKGRAYVALVWHSDIPSTTRQIGDLVLRQLGFQPLNALGKDLIAKMEETRLGLSPQLRGKKLDEFTQEWIAANLDLKQRQLYTGYVSSRFKKGKTAMPLDVLEKLDAHKQHVFANEAEMKSWLDAQGWSDEVKQQIIAAVPPTQRVADDVVVCLDLATGRTLWKAKVPGEPVGRGASSTPCLVGDKLFALGSKQLWCVDAGSGEVRWSVPLPQKGPGSSPLVIDGALIVNAQRIYAFDTATGAKLWQQDKAGGGNGSPVTWQDGDRALVLCNGRSELHALDPKTGAIVWTAPGGGDATPAVAGNKLVVQSRKPDVGLVACEISADGARELWRHPIDALRTQSSPVIHDGLVFLFDNDIHYCFDLATGARRWQETVPSTISSPLLADGKLLVLVNNGNNLAMLQPSGEKRIELGRVNVRATWVPSPALADGRLLLRMKDRIKCFDLRSSPQ